MAEPFATSTGACGKTSLLCSFALGEFPKEYVRFSLRGIFRRCDPRSVFFSNQRSSIIM
ncbi:hypothetical protein BJ912DRAFT_952887 [Pholiota molesta]|nr:hypothetical protein BJ912DRAFT_952887 [Pholiota molesta]